jgi:hypothetical protein
MTKLILRQFKELYRCYHFAYTKSLERYSQHVLFQKVLDNTEEALNKRLNNTTSIEELRSRQVLKDIMHEMMSSIEKMHKDHEKM